MTSKKLLNRLEEFTSVETVHLYVIERKTKLDHGTKARPSDKFEYAPLQIQLSPELMPVISSMLKKVIEKKIKEDVQIVEYEVIDDTIDKIYSYTDLGKISGFQEFLKNRLNKQISPLKTFEELADLEKAWALCYGFYNSKQKKWLYCIKKLQPSKMAVEIETSTSVNEAVKNGFTALFDTKTKSLKPFKGFSLNIEPSIDMIYVDEGIYIFQKKAFEDITSITEEFEVVAQEIVAEIEDIKFVDGLKHLSGVIAQKPAFRNKLIKAKAIGNLEFLKTCKDIKKEFKRAGNKLAIKFNFDGKGRVIALDEHAAEDIIKVLCEYYKEGIFGGKVFESPAGRLKK
ncbi:Kiwa anti-phage protein KwaB-like domain-containing protein [Flavisolibacter ginsengisoli]|jgi:hypothetical protein|uniref:DUF4868 domain-containing protein n=1 Tax=Flavisolibacter ginsengisoli DSM 18119 TaxID=1121884 RepID=A0A1M5FRX4_9BACT|nr:Kiwa anti-phage protein KwaB-like domain-containing protein [Flavisolibacter ginsengisoli]SHF94300.1 protein of unknown function [Flavisolibacter ginsengisoli DSM 18119]